MLVFQAVGDVLVDRKNPESIFDSVASIIKQGDINFFNCETTYTDRGYPMHPRISFRKEPRNVAGIKAAGFNVACVANNHALDWGPDGLFDTTQYFTQNDIAVVGGGKNKEEARRPVIVGKKGIKVAMLAYNSIIPQGYAATADSPGCNPMRIWTSYQQIELEQPGTPCRILTFANKDDLKTMREDIRNVRTGVDAVIVSFHGGTHFTPVEVAMYQEEISRAAIDAGADLIISHHAHHLKGIDTYKGRVIFHGLGHFATDFHFPPRDKVSAGFKQMMELFKWDPYADPEWSDYPFPADFRKTVIVRAVISKKGVEKVSFFPGLINKLAQPEVFKSKDKEFGEVLDYIKDISGKAGLKAKYAVEGDEVIVLT